MLQGALCDSLQRLACCLTHWLACSSARGRFSALHCKPWRATCNPPPPFAMQVPRFPELLAQIRAAIEQLGGAVAPKFTWSCPKVGEQQR